MINALRPTVVAALLLLPFSVSAAPKHLTILHFNDIHGHLEAEADGGGAARIAAIVRAVEEENRANGAETIVLFGGDAFSGTPISSEFRGGAEFDFFRLLGVDAMALGNHEFDFGIPRLEELASQAPFPVLSANTYWKGGAQRLMPPSAVLPTAPAVGLFGATTPETPRVTNPANVEALVFTDPIREAKEQVRELARSASVRIALTHLGVKRDMELARKVRGIAAIVGGHDHVAPGGYCRTVKKIPVCQTPANGRFVGRIDFEIDGNRAAYAGSTLIPVSPEAPEDPAAAELVAGYAKRLGKKYDVVVGKAATDLKRARGVFFPLGELVAEAARRAGKADAAFTNSGGIRSSLLKGPIRIRDVAEVLPFPNRIIVLPLRGDLLEEVIAFCAGRGGGAFLQVSGMSYRLEGGRPVDLLVAGQPLDRSRLYRIATVDFLSSGGDGLTMLKAIPNQTDTGILLRDAFVDLIRKKRVIP